MKKRNILFNLLVFGILILGLHINANAQEISVPDGYTGIYNIADLSGIRNNPSGKYILMNDIDMTEDTKKGGDWDSGMGWTPIEEFSGVLDGNGHQIIGMNIYTDTDESAEGTWYVGLIGLLKNGSIKNLGMKNVNIDVKARYVGALVGRIEFKNSPKTSVIKNCYISGDIRNTNGYNIYYSSGGIAGYIGASVYSDDTVIENCLNMANITVGTAGADSYAGGILGNCWGANFDSKVCKNCYSIGKIKGAAHNGGITLSTCGNCFYLKGSIENKEEWKQEGETALTNAQMKYAQTFTGFDFKNTWEIDSYSNYPYPQLRSNPYIRVTKLQLISMPSKTVYQQGESLNLGGSVVRITYDDGNVVDAVISEDMLGSYDMNKMGIQSITVTRGGKSVDFNIEVKGIMPSSITLNQPDIDLYKGKTYQLVGNILPQNASDKTITWSSNNSSVVTVSSTGLVTAKNAGTATITAKTINGLQAKCKVNVMVPAVQIYLDKEQIELTKGESEQVNVTLSPLNSTDKVSWTSDNSAVAKVIDGTVIGIGAGKTIVRAKTESGLSRNCSVTVKQDINEFTVSGIVDKAYTGEKNEQDIKIYSGNQTLREGTDYFIAYKNNIEVGIAEVQIVGKGYYIGSQNFTFNINKKDICKMAVYVGTSSFKYDGCAKKLQIILANGRKNLQEGRDYSCSYKDNIAPGTGSVVITGNGNYTGSRQLRFTIAMPKSNINKLTALNKRKVRITYKKIKGAAKYQVQYSMKKNFARAKTKTAKGNSLKVSRLKVKKKYYFRVRVCAKVNGKTYYSGWSKVKSVKAKK